MRSQVLARHPIAVYQKSQPLLNRKGETLLYLVQSPQHKVQVYRWCSPTLTYLLLMNL